MRGASRKGDWNSEGSLCFSRERRGERERCFVALQWPLPSDRTPFFDWKKMLIF